jgi:RsiW-degrading membrane proteinase PrsW (M82 family)
MQSCPKCGASTSPDARTCQMCGTPLAAATSESFVTPMLGRMPPDTVPGEVSPGGLNGNPSQAAIDAANGPGNESWGPGTWGPGTFPPPGTPPPGAASSMPPSLPGVNEPPALREYGTGAAGQRPERFAHPAAGPGSPFVPPYPGPGYPLIPQGGQAPISPGYPVVPGAPVYRGYPPAPGYAPYPPYPGAPAYPYGWYLPTRPPPAPGATYHKVLSILTIIACSLLILGGLFILGVLVLLVREGEGQDLTIVNLLAMSALAALAGGIGGLYHGIRALMHRVSAPFSLPSFWLLLAASVVILGTGFALFASHQPGGSLALIEPLVLLSGIIPAFTILAVGLQRLGVISSWRRSWMALTTGATLSVAAGSLLELLLALLLGAATNINSLNTTNPNLNSPSAVISILILVAVIAPLVEETTKQISGFFLLPRITSPQEAFMIGFASGAGFAMVETSAYIGMAQADWIGIAIERAGAGLVHGVGAAMAGLGWYYLIKEKGMQRQWARGFGCLAYAYAQHAVFNGGGVLLLALFPSLQSWRIDFFGLSLDATVFFAFALYIVIAVVLLIVTDELRRSASLATSKAASTLPTAGGAMAAPLTAPQTHVPENQPAGKTPTDTFGSREWDSTESGTRS